MSNFKSPSDAPFQIKSEGETISISFKQGIPSNGQGTVEWNIPTPAAGCDSDRGAYCGMVVLLSDKPLQPENIPQNGTFYTADPTADADMHVGDKIGNAFVVGAFYEGVLINQGGTPTTSFVISNTQSNTPYYVAGYAVDCQGRYHSNGVRAYSDQYAGEEEPGTRSFQEIAYAAPGILPTDGTGLTPGFLYQFEFLIDPTFPEGTEERRVKVSIDGTDASTYEQLINEINKQLALATNPLQSPIAPNTGRYYWDTVAQQLAVWDGDSHEVVTTIIEPTDPAVQTVGDYWFDGTTLQQWGTPTASVWNPVSYIPYDEDLNNLTSGDDFWFNGTDGYRWCSTTWCLEKSYNQTNDPMVVPPFTDCGHVWFDDVNGILYEWNLDTSKWEETFAITWDSAPTAIADGSHWFDIASDKLYIRVLGVWEEIIPAADVTLPTELHVVISTTQPTAPVENMYWYNNETEELALWNIGTVTFDSVPVLVWDGDPTVIDTCDLWWDSTDDSLHKWDIVNSEWDPISTFTISGIDPLTPPVITVGELWHNPTTEEMFRFDGAAWVAVKHIEYPTDPTTRVVGDAWLDTSTNTWNVWGTPVASQWNVVETVDTVTDPTTIANGTLWYDTTSDALFERIGASWVVLPFSTNEFTPTKGTQWFNTSDNMLMVWDGTSWVNDTPLVEAGITDNGNLQFRSTFVGSSACIMILVPSGATSPVNPNRVATGQAGHDFYNYGIFEHVPVSETVVDPDTFLFDHLSPDAFITAQKYGLDGVNPTPSYDVIDVGDDGSPDERRNLADRVMKQLGHPVVEVEITPDQLDIATDLALSELRARSSVAYKRGFFFLDTQPRQQTYVLADKTVGFNKVVTVMGAYRMTSAFLSSAHGAGVYGQVVLQHLYNMGTFDLLSFHLISQYVEQMEHLFATRLTYHWHEATRELQFFQSFSLQERILLDVTCERTEQEILKDRWSRNWIERFTYAESMRILAQTRGKFASLPGAGGGISLNANDLMAQHDAIKLELLADIDDYVVNDVEDIGLESTFIIG